jgi:hypothetical protein
VAAVVIDGGGRARHGEPRAIAQPAQARERRDQSPHAAGRNELAVAEALDQRGE